MAIRWIIFSGNKPSTIILILKNLAVERRRYFYATLGSCPLVLNWSQPQNFFPKPNVEMLHRKCSFDSRWDNKTKETFSVFFLAFTFLYVGDIQRCGKRAFNDFDRRFEGKLIDVANHRQDPKNGSWRKVHDFVSIRRAFGQLGVGLTLDSFEKMSLILVWKWPKPGFFYVFNIGMGKWSMSTRN